MPRVAGKNEVGRRRQDVEAERFKVGDQLRAARHHRTARRFQPIAVGQCSGGADQRQAVERVGVEAVLDPFEGLDQRRLAERVADAQAGQGMRFGQRAHDEQVGVAGDQRGSRFTAEVDVGLVDDDHSVVQFGAQAIDLGKRQRPAGWRVGVGDDDPAAVVGALEVVVDADREVGVERDLGVRDVVEAAIHRIEAVADVRHQQRLGVLEQGQERVRQHLVRTVADEDLRRFDAVFGEVFGDGVLEQVAIRVRVEAQAGRVVAEFSLHGGERARRGRVGILVGVELDEVGQLGLFARDVRRQRVDEGAPVLAHVRLTAWDAGEVQDGIMRSSRRCGAELP